jgi:hypothetical protein
MDGEDMVDPAAAVGSKQVIELALADRPEVQDALVLELLRRRDAPGLVSFTTLAAPRAADPHVRSALQAVARAPGPARSLALQALRATGIGAPRAEAVPRAPATPPLAAPAPAAAPPPDPPLAPEAVAPAGQTSWSAPFEEALADPSPANLSQAALALVDLAGTRPLSVSAAQVKDLAARLAMAAIDVTGDAQQGLGRLARGLKTLS